MNFDEGGTSSIQSLLKSLGPTLDSQPKPVNNLNHNFSHPPLHPPRNPEIDSLLDLLGPPPQPSNTNINDESKRRHSFLTFQNQGSSLNSIPLNSNTSNFSESTDSSITRSSSIINVSNVSENSNRVNDINQIGINNHVNGNEDESNTNEMHSMTFPQALMVIPTIPKAKLDAINQIQQQQHKIEKSLHTEYNVIKNKYTNQRKELDQKAALARINLSHEFNRLDQDFRKREDAFKLKALTRWNDLRPQQQSQLQSLRIPCFYVTDDKDAINTQLKVLNAISNVINES